MTELRPVEFVIDKVVEWEKWQHECIPRLRHASTLKIPHLPQLLPHDGVCAIVGAGPTVTGFVDEIRRIKEATDFNTVMTLNGAHDWLIKEEIKPRIHVIFEPDVEDVKMSLGGEPQEDVTYYICSHCHPNIFRQLEGYRRVLWHAFCPPQGYQQAINRYFKGEFMVAGGYATFFRTMTIAVILGFRDFDLFGLDASFEQSSHINGYGMADIEEQVTVWGADPSGKKLKKFLTQGGLAYQAKEFIDFCKVNQAGLRIRVHGDGLMRYVHEARYPEQYQPKGN